MNRSTNTWHQSRIIIGFIAGVILVSAQPMLAQGPFLQVGGEWDIVQDNGFRVRIKINQNQDRLSAFASHSSGKVQSIEAKGSVQGPNFKMTITWDNGTKGEYTGKFSHGPYTPPPLGYLKGRTKDLNNPGSQAGWYSEGRNFSIE